MARTMTVDLGNELQEYVNSLIKSGDYLTPSEVLRESVRALREREAGPKLAALRRMIEDGDNSGETIKWDREFILNRLRKNI